MVVPSQTLRPAHWADPRCGKHSQAALGRRLERPRQGPAMPGWESWGCVSPHRWQSVCIASPSGPLSHEQDRRSVTVTLSHISRLRISRLDLRKVMGQVRDKVQMSTNVLNITAKEKGPPTLWKTQPLPLPPYTGTPLTRSSQQGAARHSPVPLRTLKGSW